MADKTAGGASRTISNFTSKLSYDQIPAPVVAHLKLSILDGIACCLVGADLPWTRKVADMIAGEGGVPAATVFGAKRSVPLTGAVLINATAGHAFELDDIHRDAIRLWCKPATREKVSRMIAGYMEPGASMTPGQAASLHGKCGWAMLRAGLCRAPAARRIHHHQMGAMPPPRRARPLENSKSR